MRILLAIDDFHNQTNGLSISTQRFKRELEDLDQEVRVISAQIDQNRPDYPLPVMHIPFIDRLVTKEGFHFAKPVSKTIKEAVSWCDLVHIETPFPVCFQTAKIAKKMHKPVVGTMHIYPENETSSVPFLNRGWINHLMMDFFKKVSFKNCSTIICPTLKVKKRLQAFHFPQNLAVVSNGISESFLTNPHHRLKNRPFTILCIGRFSREKDQETLFNALKLVKHDKQMRVVFAGQGPLAQQYQALRKKLPLKIEMKYFTPQKMRQLMTNSDLIVHCANVEIEGMACMEAFASGVVPIIADSPLSSTASYSLSKHNQFQAGNYQQLAQQIDFWYEHPELLQKYSDQYRAFAQKLTIKNSAQKLLQIYQNLN